MEKKNVQDLSILELKAAILDNLDTISVHQHNVTAARTELARRAAENGISAESVDRIEEQTK